jgi:uncharacterized protein (TIGR02246 family)
MNLSVMDYVSVQDLIARFNRSLDDRDWSSFGALFTDDAVMTFSKETRYEGRTAIVNVVRGAEEGSYGINFHVSGSFTTDSVEQERVSIDVAALGFGVFLPEKGEGLRFSGARSKWMLLRLERSWLITECHHRVKFAAKTAVA